MKKLIPQPLEACINFGVKKLINLAHILEAHTPLEFISIRDKKDVHYKGLKHIT